MDDFLNPNTPDWVAGKYASYSNHSYSLVHAEGEVAYVLYENFEAYDINRKWLLGNVITFRWVNDRFERSKPCFQEH